VFHSGESLKTKRDKSIYSMLSNKAFLFSKERSLLGRRILSDNGKFTKLTLPSSKMQKKEDNSIRRVRSSSRTKRIRDYHLSKGRRNRKWRILKSKDWFMKLSYRASKTWSNAASSTKRVTYRSKAKPRRGFH